MSREEDDWQQLGSLEPYFAVLTEERFLRENLTADSLGELYASGERDVAMLLAAASVEPGAPLVPRNTLEFGCGVGRLTIPLGRRSQQVFAVDAAPSMLEVARAAAAEAGLTNVTFGGNDELRTTPAYSFDFVCSYLVFQHIPPAEGEEYVRTLLRLAAPSSVVALHFALRRRGSGLRRLLRRIRARSRVVHSIARALRGERRLPYIQMNEYDEVRIMILFEEAGFATPAVVAMDHGDVVGGIFVSTRTTNA